MKQIFLCLVLCLILSLIGLNLSFASPYDPYNIEPYDTDCLGNCAGRDSGGYFDRPSQGYYDLVYWIGTNDGPGKLIMQFDVLFADGPNEDFAIVTGNECWGIYAKDAKFDFYLNDALQGSFETDLSAGQIFLFDLPGDNIIANRIEVWNLTPDPPGINDDGTMEFIYAGIEQEAVNAVPIPGTIWLMSLGIVGLIGRFGLLKIRDFRVQKLT